MSLIGVNTFLFRGNLCHKRLSFELLVSKLYKLSFSFSKSDKYALTNRLSLIKVISMKEDFFPFRRKPEPLWSFSCIRVYN